MANKYEGKENAEKKVSSLSGDTLSPMARSGSGAGKRNKKETTVGGKRRFSWRGFVVDLVLLVIICGIAVGVWFGYNTVKNIYMPEWDTRQVEICVEIPDMEYRRALVFLTDIDGQQLFGSNETEGVCYGVIQSAGYSSIGAEDQQEEMVTLTVTVQAQYRRGEGYYVNATRILAGEAATFRANGFAFDGMIVYLRDVSEVAS